MSVIKHIINYRTFDNSEKYNFAKEIFLKNEE